ncbi:cellulose binding domain-containing protein [Actinomadura kijaniata]|uniref:cellulose binding domain-containing protein n=1 Tax=Actinomadura kijaniata TaxID=46161 RepID=UPI003F1BE395
MSGEEPGRVPPDHKTTTEFKIPAARPEGPAETAEPAGDAGEATVVDRPAGPGDTARDDVRNGGDDTRDDVGATAFDVPRSPAPEGEAPTEADATVTDFRAEGGPGGGDEPPATVVDLRKEQTGAPPLAAEVPEAPWTAQFGAEAAETAEERPGPPVGPAAAGSAAAEAATAPTPVGPTPSHLQAEAPTAPHGARPAESPTGPTPPVGPPVPGQEGPGGQGRSRKPAVLVAAVAAVAIVGAGAAAALVLSQGDDKPTPTGARTAPPAASTPPAAPTTPGAAPTTAPAAPPTAGPTSPGTQPAPGQQPTAPPAGGTPTTAPSAPAVPVGPLRTGDGITYQLVQRDPGYFESRMVITNRSSRPLRSWKITFEAPGANVRNIWGGRLVRRGSKVEIHNLPDGVPLPPGATWQIQYGASGAPVDPKGCRFGDKPCGF